MTSAASTRQVQTLAPSKWEAIADTETLKETVDSLKMRGFKAELVPDAGAALERIRSLISAGATVMTAGSATLEEIGFTELLKSGNHPWVNLKDEILNERDVQTQIALRKRAALSQYFLGSVQSVTKTGQLVVGSGSGSQLAAYAYGADNVILVVGAQKITNTLEEATARLRQHTFLLEDARMKSLGYPGANLSKILIWENEWKRKVCILLVNEKLGF